MCIKLQNFSVVLIALLSLNENGYSPLCWSFNCSEDFLVHSIPLMDLSNDLVVL